MHFSQTTSFSCILGRAVKSTARVQLGLNHDYKPETLQQKHLQCRVKTYDYYSHGKKFVGKIFSSPFEAHFLDYVSCYIFWDTLSQFSISEKKNKKVFHQFFPAELRHYLPEFK